MALTSLLFLVAFGAGLLLCVLRHPVYGLYTYIAVFYLDPSSRWWGEQLPDLRWSFTAAAITFLCTLFRSGDPARRSVFSHAPVRIFMAFVALVLLQSPWALNQEEHAFAVSLFPKYIVVIYFFYALVNSIERLKGVLFAHAMGCFFLGLLAYGEYGGGRLDGIGGPGIGDANTLAVQLSTGAFAAFAVYLSGTGMMRWLSAASIPFILNTVVMTGARGGFLAIVAGALAFFLFRPPGKLKVIALYALIGATAFAYVANDFFWQRMRTIPTDMNEAAQIEDGSVDSRLAIIEAQWQIFLDHPFGGGHRTTTALSYRYIDEAYHSAQGGRSSHNTFMSTLVDQGFIGFLLWTSLLWVLIRRVRRIRAQASDSPELAWLNATIAAGITVVTVAGMFYPLERLEVYVWLISLTCAAVSFTRASANTAGSPNLARDASSPTVPTVGYNTRYHQPAPSYRPRHDAGSDGNATSNKW
jgi:hypothetical protein